MAKEMVKKEESALATVPDYLKEDLSHNDLGNENVGRDDLIVPRLKQLQQLSPEVDKGDAKYVPGAEAGSFFNSLTRTVVEPPVVFCPFHYDMTYVVFKKREAGGGFVGAFTTEKEAIEEMRLQADADKMEVSQTAVHWVVYQGADGKWQEAALHMPSTKLTASRELNSLVKLRGGARWSHLYVISSKQDEVRGKGKFHRLVVGNGPRNADGTEIWPLKEVVEKCRDYHEMAVNKKIRVDSVEESPGANSPEF